MVCPLLERKRQGKKTIERTPMAKEHEGQHAFALDSMNLTTAGTTTTTMMTTAGQDHEGNVGPRRGRCKWFNVVKGWGFITPDDGGQEVFVHQSVIQMGGFRSLGENEEVEFESKLTSKGYEATGVHGPSHAECKGSDFRPYSKKRRFRKVRCYNCGEFANHIASKCALGPLPKRCHHCRGEDHLIVDCPTKPTPQEKSSHEPQPEPEPSGLGARFVSPLDENASH